MMQIQQKVSEHTEGSANIQLIVFLAGNEEFGVPIEEVREIIKVSLVTPIPDSPDFIKGIVNVRGEIVTVIDVKIRFKLSNPDKTEPKHIVVTRQDDALFGLLVDEVIEVLRIQKTEISPPPSIVPNIQKKYINGIVSHNDRLIILLDLAEILSHKELLQIPMPHKKTKNNKSS